MHLARRFVRMGTAVAVALIGEQMDICFMFVFFI